VDVGGSVAMLLMLFDILLSVWLWLCVCVCLQIQEMVREFFGGKELCKVPRARPRGARSGLGML